MSHYHFSLDFGFFDYLFLYFISCTFYKLLTNTSIKAASTDGPFGLLAACPIFNIEMSYCDVDYWANKMLAC